MNDKLKQQIREVIAKHSLCVISTVDKQSKPESAIVGYSESNELELMIGTSHLTRKYANIQQNPHVAVVIGDQFAEVQYEGTIRQLDKAELEERLEVRFKKLPGTRKYMEDPNQVWLLVTPSWVRLTVHSSPNVVEEMRFA